MFFGSVIGVEGPREKWQACGFDAARMVASACERYAHLAFISAPALINVRQNELECLLEKLKVLTVAYCRAITTTYEECASESVDSITPSELKRVANLLNCGRSRHAIRVFIGTGTGACKFPAFEEIGEV